MSKIDQYRTPLQCRLRQIVRNVPSVSGAFLRMSFSALRNVISHLLSPCLSCFPLI